MKTLIIGGGKGCKSLLELAEGSFLKEFRMNIKAVCDINPNAPGMEYAKSIGLDTFVDFNQAITEGDYELIIELTGSDTFLEILHSKIRKGIKLIDHTIAQIFWDLVNTKKELAEQYHGLEILEQSIEKERLFLQSIFDANSDLCIVLDTEKNILRANKKFLEFAEKSKEEVIGKRCIDVLSDTDIDCGSDDYKGMFDKILTEKVPQTIIKKSMPPHESHWEITRTPIFNRMGDIESILGSWHKITEEIQLKRDIETAEQRFRSFIYSAKDWISIKDREGRYIIVNPATASTFGKEVSDFIGKKPSEIFYKDMADMINKHDEQVIKEQRAIPFRETVMVDEQEKFFDTIRFPMTNYKNDLIGVCTIARDITKEVLLKEQLIQSEKLAALGKLAAGVAHEINNPLTGILAYAEDLKIELSSNTLVGEDLDVIIRETLRCRDIVRNLLDFAKQDKPVLEKTNINDIISNSLKLVNKMPQFKDININFALMNNLPDILADAKQMQQVILNLLLNAADAMKYRGEILIRTNTFVGKVLLSIEDSGPGIPENLIDKIFEPFFSTKGTNGLGLAVSWGIIERHRGNIEIDTADSGGAIFNIFLPIAME